MTTFVEAHIKFVQFPLKAIRTLHVAVIFAVLVPQFQGISCGSHLAMQSATN